MKIKGLPESNDPENINAKIPLNTHNHKSLVGMVTPRHMEHKIDRVTGENESDKKIEKISETQISYDPILGDDDDEMDEASTPCDSESIKYNTCKKNTDKTGKNTDQLTSKDSKRNHQFIIVDSYMHDDDEPHFSRSRGNKYTRDYEDLIVTYSTYKRDGLRWRKDTKETYNVFRSIDKKNLILPAGDAPLSENSVLSRNSKNDADDNTIPVFEEPPRTDISEDYEEYETYTFDLWTRNHDFEKYLEKFLAGQQQRQLARQREEDNIDRIFKKTNLIDFFRDPVASVVEVLEYVSCWIANALSLPPPDPIDYDKLIYKREENNFSIKVAGLLKENKVLFSYSRDVANNSDGGEAIGYMFMNH